MAQSCFAGRSGRPGRGRNVLFPSTHAKGASQDPRAARVRPGLRAHSGALGLAPPGSWRWRGLGRPCPPRLRLSRWYPGRNRLLQPQSPPALSAWPALCPTASSPRGGRCTPEALQPAARAADGRDWARGGGCGHGGGFGFRAARRRPIPDRRLRSLAQPEPEPKPEPTASPRGRRVRAARPGRGRARAVRSAAAAAGTHARGPAWPGVTRASERARASGEWGRPRRGVRVGARGGVPRGPAPPPPPVANAVAKLPPPPGPRSGPPRGSCQNLAAAARPDSVRGGRSPSSASSPAPSSAPARPRPAPPPPPALGPHRPAPAPPRPPGPGARPPARPLPARPPARADVCECVSGTRRRRPRRRGRCERLRRPAGTRAAEAEAEARAEAAATAGAAPPAPPGAPAPGPRTRMSSEEDRGAERPPEEPCAPAPSPAAAADKRPRGRPRKDGASPFPRARKK